MDIRVFGVTVAFDISKPFLDDTKKAKRDVIGKVTGNILVCKFHLNVLCYLKLLAKSVDTGNQAQAFKRGGM